MLTYEIPGQGRLQLSTLVLDLNGTATIDGKVVPGVAQRIAKLSSQGLVCHLLTADTRENGAETAAALGISLHRLTPGDERVQKRAFVEQQGAEHVVAIGNGANNAGMLEAAALGIAVLQVEGTAAAAWRAADVVKPGVCAALDILLAQP